MEAQVGTFAVKKGLAQMLKGGVIMDVVTAEHAKIAEEAGACAVMALERVPADIRKDPDGVLAEVEARRATCSCLHEYAGLDPFDLCFVFRASDLMMHEFA